jgi:hypothetical protein
MTHVPEKIEARDGGNGAPDIDWRPALAEPGKVDPLGCKSAAPHL